MLYNEVLALDFELVDTPTTSQAFYGKILVKDTNGQAVELPDPFAVRARLCGNDPSDLAPAGSGSIAAGSGARLSYIGEDIDTNARDVIVANPTKVKATSTLVNVVGGHLSSFQIGQRKYVFDTVGNLQLSGNEVAVSLVGITGLVTATQVLGIATNPTAGDTITIGTTGYQFVAAGTANQVGEIALGATAAVTQANILAALNGTDGIHSANVDVTPGEWSSNDLLLTARIPGTTSNSIPTTSSLTAGSDGFDGTTMGTGAGATAGANPSAALQGDEIAEVITNDPGAEFAAVSNGSGTVTLTAKQFGTNYNYTAVSDVVSGTVNNSSGGLDATPGEIYVRLSVPTTGEFRLFLGQAAVQSTAVSCPQYFSIQADS